MKFSIQIFIIGFVVFLLFPSQLLAQKSAYRKSARKARKEYQQSLPDSLKKKPFEWGILVSIGGLTPDFSTIENRQIPNLHLLAEYNAGRDLSAGLMIRYSVPFTNKILRLQHELSYETSQISGNKVRPVPFGICCLSEEIDVHSKIAFFQFVSLLQVSIPVKSFRIFLHGGASMGRVLNGYTDLIHTSIAPWDVTSRLTHDNRRGLNMNHLIIGGGIGFKRIEIEYRYRTGTGIINLSDMKHYNFMLKFFF